METLLGNQGAYVDDIYICPHHPDAGFNGEIKELKITCNFRKPKPGLIIKVANDYNIDLKASWTVGDSWRDIECGINASTRTILIEGNEKRIKEYYPNFITSDLFGAVEIILSQEDCNTIDF